MLMIPMKTTQSQASLMWNFVRGVRLLVRPWRATTVQRRASPASGGPSEAVLSNWRQVRLRAKWTAQAVANIHADVKGTGSRQTIKLLSGLPWEKPFDWPVKAGRLPVETLIGVGVACRRIRTRSGIADDA